MLYKLNEVGELLECESVYCSDGTNAGYIFFETKEDAYSYFVKDIYTKIEEQQILIDTLLIESLNYAIQ